MLHSITMYVSKIVEDAIVPTRGSDGAVGYDLYSIESITIPPQERHAIKTGIRVCIPDGYYGRVAPRSGYAFRNGIDVLAGVIDPDYRGELIVILYNSSNEDSFGVTHGQRIAQLIVEKCSTPEIVEVNDEVFKTIGTTRGESGFGSTGT